MTLSVKIVNVSESTKIKYVDFCQPSHASLDFKNQTCTYLKFYNHGCQVASLALCWNTKLKSNVW